FDYEEQKRKLIHNGHKFKFENNDAEYCLHLYEEMGKDAFRGLNGSFCIAIYNLVTYEILLVNDRFSSRPLFYYLTDKGTLLFGTQLSLILQSSGVPRELNIGAIFEFFTFKKVLGTETFHKDINVLPPATVLNYKDSSISLTHYWEMKYKEEKHPEEYYVNNLAEAIKKSVERRTQGNYRFGLLLSGGLDARTVLAASDKKMVCFTLGDFENKEVKIARRIAEAKGCKHIFLKRNSDHYVNLVDKAVEIGDGMYSFAHAHNIGFFDEIRKECDVLLHGFLFDNLFKGWGIPTKNIKIFGKTINIPFYNYSCGMFTLLDNSLYYKGTEQLFTNAHSAQFKNSIKGSLNNFFACTEKNGAMDFNRKFDCFAFPSASNLHATHNQVYINERAVSLDNDLFDLYLETPVRLKTHGKIFKKAMKKIDSKIAKISNANTGLSPTTPVLLEWTIAMAKSIFRKMVSRKKHSLTNPTYTQESWPNFAELIRHNEKMKKLIDDTIRDPECLNPNIFNIQRIEEMFEEHLNGKNDCTDFLFLLLTFGRWHKKYGPRSV
ncbi:MAG: hypothetical protein KAH35_01120, partial [Candidatus Atribacteria bacterium]|nr:hypothetical protein [Candidatus Atribacteria bacterium]